MQETDRQPTPKQRAFIEAYLGEARFNAVKAAEIAGYGSPHARGWELRVNPLIARAIEDELAARAATANEILTELREVAFAPTTHFMQVTGVDKETGDLQVRQDYSSKIKSLELLGKHHGLFTDKVEHSGGVLIRGYPGVDVNAV